MTLPVQAPEAAPAALGRGWGAAGRGCALPSFMATFEETGLDPRLLRALAKRGLTAPTPVQAAAIPKVPPSMQPALPRSRVDAHGLRRTTSHASHLQFSLESLKAAMKMQTAWDLVTSS